MLDARCAIRRPPVSTLSAARRSRVSACFGSVQRTAYRIRILPEPMSRNGLSLVRNSAFATITESMFPSCTFDIAQKTPVNPFDPRLLRSASVSRPMQGDLIAGHPLFTRISRALPTSTASTPLQAFSALRIKAFNRSGCKKLTSRNARTSFTPRCDFLAIRASDQRSGLASSRSANRSVNPGTESIMTPSPAFRQSKSGAFPYVSSGFLSITIQSLAR